MVLVEQGEPPRSVCLASRQLPRRAGPLATRGLGKLRQLDLPRLLWTERLAERVVLSLTKS